MNLEHPVTIALVWFRHDLRLNDNPAFITACSQNQQVIPLYIYEGQHSVLGRAQDWWLHHSLASLGRSLKELGMNLVLRKGNPSEIILDLVRTVPLHSVYWNRCYDRHAISRDKKIKKTLQDMGINVQSSNGSLLHEPWTIKNKNGEFFKIFTPYWNHCLKSLSVPPAMGLPCHPKGMEIPGDALAQWHLLPRPNWAARFPDYWTPGEDGAQKKLDHFIDHHLPGYKKNRDIPEKNATSLLSPHLHFGEISPWAVLRAVEMARQDPRCDLASAERFVSELGWREFSVYLLYHFPRLPYDNFKDEFDAFLWQNEEQLLACWKKGMTGYPIVDAGMRELWATGYMHNRVRMISASFLTKGLFIDWRLGADWFLDTLVDADLANNSASWQWVAGCGADAAPYFRIFNPILQSQKCDPDGVYIRRWVPELASIQGKSIHTPWQDGLCSTDYPKPIINHTESRIKALDYYRQLKKK